MEIKSTRISWFVLPNDKYFFQELATREGKTKWAIFNEARLALEEKRERDAKILKNFEVLNNANNDTTAISINQNKTSEQHPDANNNNGKTETPAANAGFFGRFRKRVR